MGFGLNVLNLCVLLLLLLSSCCFCFCVSSDLLLFKLHRRIDLTSQVVRVTSTLTVENKGTDPVSEVLLAFTANQAKNLAYLAASAIERKGKTKISTNGLPIQVVPRDHEFTIYSVSLPNKLGKGETSTLDVLAVFTHALKPLPDKISQDQLQFVVFEDSAYYLSPYEVKFQSLSVKLPHDPKIESYTKLGKTKVAGSEIKYGPYENIPALTKEPTIRVHFENKQPFAVAQELVREIEISHWGNVQVTEHYNLIHGGAESKGEFSRLDYQARPHVRGASAFKRLVAKLPPRAHSVYYRDEIGNISTSNLWGDSKKTQLEIEPRYPMFGGWRTTFTIGYGLPLKDFLFQSAGKRFLNISFGSPISDLVTDNLIVKVVLPEGSSDISVSAPFSIEEKSETKFSHLDIVGRPVVVLEKKNVVQEHNQQFQVYYKFSNLSLLQEPLMLISGIFFLFIACIVYMHADLTISKTSASYVASLQWDEVRTVIQQLLSIVNRCLVVHDKIELSLRDLSRTGDVQACKAARKTADVLLKEFPKELKPLLAFLHSCPQAAQISPKVEELVAKERELQERLMAKHSTVVESYEKKSGGKEAENRVASIQQKITALRQDVEDLLDVIDEI